MCLGEHITEVLLWSSVEWIHSVQFVTNMGRVSTRYGGADGKPTILKSRNGVLVGLVSMSREHPGEKIDRITKLQVGTAVAHNQ
jgi:hypothetical protein